MGQRKPLLHLLCHSLAAKGAQGASLLALPLPQSVNHSSFQRMPCNPPVLLEMPPESKATCPLK